ncbi:TlpA disulfide reductase family protein [uncultured Algoriphagus sp.]|uniref:TlpA family protein disulfide reductase n=1 Tax=uncultured Algoriphagus sp. TaxID=417365 RepID=UPI0030EB87E6
MKKHLYTCFLASLCLYGSTSTAQVADSPGADFLHRSMPHVSTDTGDTHRGGEIRSDNLPEVFDLVDHSAAKGQEGESPSARMGEQAYFTIRAEVNSASETSAVLHWEIRELELDTRYDYSWLQQDTLQLNAGNFFSGTQGKQVSESRISMSESIGRFHLWDGQHVLLENIWIQAGDSLAVLWDQSTGKLLLSGPDADKIRLQVHLQELDRTAKANLNPAMILSDVGRILDSPEKQEEYNRISEQYRTGWNRKMLWLDSEEERIKRASQLLQLSSPESSILSELSRHQEDLDPDLYAWLHAYWTGKLRKEAMEFIAIARPESMDWAELLLRFGMQSEDISAVQDWKVVPAEWTESVYLENKLLERVSPVSFFYLSATLPESLRDQVDALYLIREYRNTSEADSLISAVLDRMQNPWVEGYLQKIYESNIAGREVLNYPLMASDGSEVYPISWKGKLVMLDFWLSGCGSCLKFAKNNFLPLMQAYEAHPEILFVTISGDSEVERWQKSLESGLYTAETSLNLFSGGISHPFLKQYQIQAFPAQLLLDKEGKILRTGDFPSTLEGWSQLIESYLASPKPVSTSHLITP